MQEKLHQEPKRPQILTSLRQFLMEKCGAVHLNVISICATSLHTVKRNSDGTRPLARGCQSKLSPRRAKFLEFRNMLFIFQYFLLPFLLVGMPLAWHTVPMCMQTYALYVQPAACVCAKGARCGRGNKQIIIPEEEPKNEWDLHKCAHSLNKVS